MATPRNDPETTSKPIVDSPYLSAEATAKRLPGKRSKRFVLKECKAGRMRHARIGGRGEVVIKAEWLDQYVEDHAAPVIVPPRRSLREVS